MSNTNFEWIEFYTRFANELLKYKKDRITLISKLRKVYRDININFPTIEKDNDIIDIDPFTVYGLFNKQIKHTNRTLIVRGLANEFKINTVIPTSFNGIPTLNNMAAAFVKFKDERGANDIDNLWELFENALLLADNNDQNKYMANVSQLFDKVSKQSGIKWNITMGLFWIRPYYFLNLDSINRIYLTKVDEIFKSNGYNEAMFKDIMDGFTYINLCLDSRKIIENNDLPYKNIPELSNYAWMITEQVNNENKSNDKETSNAIIDSNIDEIRYWTYSPGEEASKWDDFYKKGIMAIGWGLIGNLNDFSTKDDMKLKMKKIYDKKYTYKNAAHATWQFAKEMKKGDIIFVKKGRSHIIGRGIVISDYEYDQDMEDDYNNVRQVKWTHRGNWDIDSMLAMKTLTDVTPYSEFVKEISEFFNIEDDIEEQESKYTLYSKDDFLSEAYMTADEYKVITDLLDSKKNLIIQGAPGVGKTYIAKRLAYSMMGKIDKERVKMVQFHQSYSYEDFIEGYRPSEKGFILKKGAFYEFCKKAEVDDVNNKYFFIIDEINRGNLSKIFGELFMLIENDKRGEKIELLYSGEKFSVPSNVYIIGLMNTADRSLALLDYALRRRFSFYEMKPSFDTEGFIKYQKEINDTKFDKLIKYIKELNNTISQDESLGKGFMIGHSYFCNIDKNKLDIELNKIIEYEIVPLLNEYWFDEPTLVDDWSGKLRSAISE